MRAGPIVATLAVLGGIPFIAAYQHYQEEHDRKVIDQIEDSLQQNDNQLADKALAMQQQFIQKTQGDAAARLFQSCNHFPPTQTKGVLQCQAIIERMRKRHGQAKTLTDR